MLSGPVFPDREHGFLKRVHPTPRAAAPSPGTGASRSFPIVGLGASAGGLEALQAFLKHVPPASGMAFVVVQHLDPTQKGALTELLQRATPMKVMQVVDRTRVKPDCVYVIPPNRDLSILRGILHLLVPSAPRGLRLPIDFFFRALADDVHERSIGVVLSGMGSDGTLGLAAIKGRAGAVFVQDPATARFDSMPRSAVNAGLADVVAAVEELPRRIVAYVNHVPALAAPASSEADRSHSALEKVVILLRAHTGHDFSLYKKNTLYRRIERRMGIHQLDRIVAYVRLLQEVPGELDLLFKELLIGVTAFFRDPASWEELRTRVLPKLLKQHPPGQPLRAWVPGCSTGEEAYTLAIVLREALERSNRPRPGGFQIFATDLDRDAIEKARAGLYPANIAADVSPDRLMRHFAQVPHGYQVSSTVRESVIFAPQNLVMDPPFTRLDLVCCRNLLIYLEPDLQKRLFPLFHYSLNPGGFLFLGSAESVGGMTDLFAPVKGKARLYRRLETGSRLIPLVFPGAIDPSRRGATAAPASAPATLQAIAEQLLLRRYSPVGVLVNEQGDILYISGRTGRYLEPPAGKSNWNILAMAREGLRHELAQALRDAQRTRRETTRKSVVVRGDGKAQLVDLSVQVLTEPDAVRGLVMVVISDVPEPDVKRRPARSAPASRRVAALQQALDEARIEVQSAREESLASHEEARSAYEELQSANEELQSTNEELTTSKEEMQSMNEELQTVNQELQAKVDELSRLNNDMKNLLDNTEITSVFLDTALRLRLYTAGSTGILNLIATDVGRPITDIASELIYPELAADAREVLRTLLPRQHEVSARDGRRFVVRIMPYRTLANVIDGVVITYSGITASAARTARPRARRGPARP